MGAEIGSIIYTAVKPIFKIYLIIGSGFWLGRKNILTVETSKQVSTIVVLLILPVLIFDKIVTNIDNSDIKQIGIICLVSFFLYAVGGVTSLFVYYLTGVPNYWFGGCLSAGLFPNVAELPIAYVSTLGSIFTDEEIEKGISYVIIFLATYCLLQFNFGAIMLIEMDYKTFDKMEKEKKITDDDNGRLQDEENNSNVERITSDINENKPYNPSRNNVQLNLTDQDSEFNIEPLRRVNTINSIYSTNLELRKLDSQRIQDVIEDYQKEELLFTKVKSSLKSNFKPYIFLKFFVENCKRPISLALIVSITIAMIPWLQALFISSTQYQYPNAPDRNPPLSFIMNFTNYLSQACVPLGILILGATLSRLQVSKETLNRKVLLTPLCLSIIRLAIMPIIGILFITKLKNDGWFNDDKILLFVCCISFGLPCATSLIYLTATFSNGEDYQMKSLSMVYIFQYPILAVSLPFLTTYTVMKVLDS